MHAERDWLRTRVFPRLAELLGERRHHLELIDLRIGVDSGGISTEEARELRVLKVCLDEIERSRPFLLVVLGDRYGWQPPEALIADAAHERGFDTLLSGKSVTALEIEYGLRQSDPTKVRHCLVFLRQPLPYDQMSETMRQRYSDAFSPDPILRAGYDKLVALKDSLRADPAVGLNVFDYPAEWDSAAQRVGGLAAFGDLVFEKLAAAILEATPASTVSTLPDWEELERGALEEFIEHRSRIFVGRTEVMHRLARITGAPTVRDTVASMECGACLVGSAGSGKSAVFASLYRLVATDSSTLVLANAAGSTMRGASVEAMLRRWVGELSVADGRPVPPLEDATVDEVAATFYRLLGKVSSRRRVVVMIDGLDQFEQTPRGRFATWFKASDWPSNARLICTGLPCPAIDALMRTARFTQVILPALDIADATDIGERIWGRYNRTLNAAVFAALREKRMANGEPSYGNPLWLLLALEQLSLLDADDFARTDGAFVGSPSEQMLALVVENATGIPPDLDELFGWLLARNEKVFGPRLTRAFAVCIALSSSGWREVDLLGLMPCIGQLLLSAEDATPLSHLELAALRRHFRAHIVRRRVNGQLDFFHLQMRHALLANVALTAEKERALHAAISDYLESLPVDDPVMRVERMIHLLGERDPLRAARYFATLALEKESADALRAAVVTLVEWLIADESTRAADRGIAWIASWLDVPELEDGELAQLIDNLLFVLLRQMEGQMSIGQRHSLLAAVAKALRRMAARDPRKTLWQRQLAACLGLTGDLQLLEGKVAEAHAAFAEGAAITEQLLATHGPQALWTRDLAVSFDRISQVLEVQGNLAGAVDAAEKSFALRKSLATEGEQRELLQREVSVSYTRLGELRQKEGNLSAAETAFATARSINTRMAVRSHDATRLSGLVVSHFKAGSLKEAQGHLASALKSFAKASQCAERLVSVDPWRAEALRNLSAINARIGDILMLQGHLSDALVAYRRDLALSESAADADPGNAQSQFNLSICHEKVGDVLLAQGNLEGALAEYRRDLSIVSRLVTDDSLNVAWQRGLAVTHTKIGDVMQAQGKLREAKAAFLQSLRIRTRLAEKDPTNATAQRDTAVSFDRLGLVLGELGNVEGAHNAFCQSLAVSERLAKTDPHNALWQRDLAISLDRLAAMLEAQGNPTGAWTAIQRALAIREHLVAADPSNAQSQSDLAVSLDNLASMLVAQRDPSAARTALARSLAIRKRLAKEKANANAQRDLAIGLVAMGDFAARRGGDDARDWWNEAFEILSTLKGRGALRPTDEELLVSTKEKISRSFRSVGIHSRSETGAHKKQYAPDRAALLRVATQEFAKANWVAAAAAYQRLLAQDGIALREGAPRLVTALLSLPHLAPHDQQLLQDIQKRLELAGETDLLITLRRQIQDCGKTSRAHAARAWWRFWK